MAENETRIPTTKEFIKVTVRSFPAVALTVAAAYVAGKAIMAIEDMDFKKVRKTIGYGLAKVAKKCYGEEENVNAEDA